MTLQRPSGFPEPNHPLLLAARYNDAEAEEHGFETVLQRIGLDFEALHHIAEQRALRAVLATSGKMGMLRRVAAGEVIPVAEMNQRERETIAMYTGMYIDAIALGWRAQQLTHEEE